MSLLSKIEALIEEEVQRRLNMHLEKISQRYDISLKVLLDDVDSPEVPVERKDDKCKGILANKKRCGHKAKNEGYCGKHQGQIPKRKTIVTTSPVNKVTHNHTIPPLYRPDCPACMAAKTKPTNLLIEI
jgi:hypothetical protein